MTLATTVVVCLSLGSAWVPVRTGLVPLEPSAAFWQQTNSSSSQPSEPQNASQPQQTAPAATDQEQTKLPKKPGLPASAAKKTHRRKKRAGTKAPSGPAKVVVKNGGATDPPIQIAPGVSQQQATSQQKSSSQLLARADENLKTVTARQLNANQQDVVKQIQQYIEQAKAARVAGDTEREHNLALKAQLLSEALVKP